MGKILFSAAKKQHNHPQSERAHGPLSEKVLAVFALYDGLIDRLLQLSAALLDGRENDAAALRKNCLSLLTMLDEGLVYQGELAENLHILYGHCLRRLDLPVLPDMETVDAVRKVVLRLRHVYAHLAKTHEA